MPRGCRVVVVIALRGHHVVEGVAIFQIRGDILAFYLFTKMFCSVLIEDVYLQKC